MGYKSSRARVKEKKTGTQKRHRRNVPSPAEENSTTAVNNESTSNRTVNGTVDGTVDNSDENLHLASVTQGRSMLWRMGLPLPWLPSPVPPSGSGGMDLRAARSAEQTLRTARRFLLSLFFRSSSDSSIPP